VEYKAMWLTPLLLVIHNFEEQLTMQTFISRYWQDFVSTVPMLPKKKALT
jgi:hypothetical protein